MNGFALRALSVLAGQMRKPVNDNVRRICLSEEEILEALLKAVCHPDRACFDQTVTRMLDAGSSCEDIANRHVPAVARALGEAWLDDRMEFASVSIACARLQGYLRNKGLDWCDRSHLSAKPKSTVLLVVPEFEQHTLGATLLAGQLRAQGVSVTLELNVPTDGIGRFTLQRSYDAILISSSRDQTLELLAPFVSKARKYCADAPIIIGGNVLDQSPHVIAKSGADFTANCWQGALEILNRDEKHSEAELVGCRG